MPKERRMSNQITLLIEGLCDTLDSALAELESEPRKDESSFDEHVDQALAIQDA